MENEFEISITKPKTSDQQMADFFKIFSHPSRIQILWLLREKPLCVCEITPKFQESQASISKHLRFMKDIGILTYTQQGTRNIYGISDQGVFEILENSRQILKRIFEKSLLSINEGN